MARRIVPLTLDGFAAIGSPCRDCLFWELDPVRRRAVRTGTEPAHKEAWFSEVLREWGSCGRIAMVEGRAVGYVVYVPARFAPGAQGFPTAPVSHDAVLLTTLWLDPAYAGGGIGRMLIQGMASDLVKRKVRAVEAFGDTGPGSRLHGSRCAAPAEFLARVGFKTHRPHPTAPRYRMDLRQAVTWKGEVESAWQRLVRPRRVGASAPARSAGSALMEPVNAPNRR